MTFEEHEKAILAARSALNDAIYEAAGNKIKVHYDKWDTTVHGTSTNLVGRLELVSEMSGLMEDDFTTEFIQRLIAMGVSDYEAQPFNLAGPIFHKMRQDRINRNLTDGKNRKQRRAEASRRKK